MIERPGTILIVDDEHSIVDLVGSYLDRERFRVLRAYDGEEALAIARRELPDVVVLDLMLPGVDGIEVCRQIRQFSDAYVLMLTARTEEVDRIVGLSVGADDYVTKPFSPRELVARVRALLRRPRSLGTSSASELPGPIQMDDLIIDLAAHEVTLGAEVVALTPLEFQLLATLVEHLGMVYTRRQLLDRVWGGDFYGDDHVVDVHISNLRKKIEPDPAQPSYIETVRGVGYRFRRAKE